MTALPMPDPDPNDADRDALALARAILGGDDPAAQAIWRSSNPWAVQCRLIGWLQAAIGAALDAGAGQPYGDRTVDDVLARWQHLVIADEAASEPGAGQ